MSDLIDRQAVQDIINATCEQCGKYKENNGVMCGACELDGVKDSIEDLPSAEPERTKGKWITSPDNTGWIVYECSICGLHRGTDGYNFCPNCGADMREEE